MLRKLMVGLVVGTRPEAIKLAPVADALAAADLQPWILLTGQHPGLSLSEHGLDRFEAMSLGCPGQSKPDTHVEQVNDALQQCWSLRRPSLVLVQGGTSSALGGARAASSSGIALGHVEAGLRTYDDERPWPEEGYRRAIDAQADLLFAPTEGNAANLRHEKVRGRIFVTGNSGIDALLKRQERRLVPRLWRPRRPLALVTCHRRENWGDGLDRLCDSLIALAARRRVRIEFVLHPNPRVSGQAYDRLGPVSAIRLLPPLSSAAMIAAMRRADLLMSDSGGMQEEAAAMGLPTLVLRDVTERMESIDSGNAVLVGTDPRRILTAVESFLRDPRVRAAMSRPALLFGDGHAAPRIAAACRRWLGEGYGEERLSA